MRRKSLITCALLLLLILAGVFIYLKYGALKAKDYKPDAAKARSLTDLRPSLIAKLRQLVRDGSDSLYKLSIDTLNADVFAATIDASGVQLLIDSPGYRRLLALKALPDELYQIRFETLHMDGIGPEDLLHAKDIRLKGIHFRTSCIEVWHKDQPYNAADREKAAHVTLYQRLTKSIHSISIGSISLEGTTYVLHEVGRNDQATTFRNVSVSLSDILVDSSTQYVADRVLFAKQAALQCRDYSILTPDGRYLFKIGRLDVSGTGHSLEATDISLVPRGGRKTFERSMRTRQEMFTVSLPHIALTGIDWRALVLGKSCVAQHLAIDGGKLNIYLDKSRPASTTPVKADNFPQQMLMDLSFPVAVDTLQVGHLDMVYEEYSPDAKESGAVIISSINGHGEHISNIPARIKKWPVMPFTGAGLFMNKVPMGGRFSFELPKMLHGAFTADIHMGEMDAELTNAFATPLGGVIFTSGHMEDGTAHIQGNNYSIKGNVLVRYDHLHITPINKKKRNNEGDFKKQHLLSFIGNAVLIKNANPGRFGQLRRAQISWDRKESGNFFNFSWSAVKSGLLKTIGVPPQIGM